MAQAQIKPRERQGDQVVEQFRELVDRLRRTGLTENQREQVRQFLDEMTRMMQQAPTTRPATPTQTAPQSRRTPAPRRVEQFVYDISLGGRTYRMALAEPLPTLRGGGIDLADAQRRLHDLLLNNALVTRANPNDPASPVVPLAQVTMPGTSTADQRFNAGTPNQRLDQFRDAYLNLTFRNGRYVESTAVRIAEVPQEGSTRRN